MHNRRGFLKTTLGLAMSAGSGLAPSPAEDQRPSIPPSTPEHEEYETILAQSPVLELLGLPRNWSMVRHGFHPFSPERVVILASDNHPNLGRTLLDAKKQIWSRIEVQHMRTRDSLMSSAKFDLLVAFADYMAAYYQRLDLSEEWAFRLTRREQLGSCGLGRGFGLIHQFQRDEVVKTANAIVDWWLFLLPDGADYESLDGNPVHLLIGHVFDQRRFSWEYRVWELMMILVRNISRWAENPDGVSPGLLDVARMDRVSAARLLNHRLALCLEGRS